MYELYNGVRKAAEMCPSLGGIQDTQTYLEQRYTKLATNNDEYLALNHLAHIELPTQKLPDGEKMT